MKEAIQYIRSELNGIYPEEEISGMVRVLLEAVTGWDYTGQLLHANEKLSNEQVNQIQSALARLKKHEPIQYVLGETEFMGFRIQVNPSVLIPRQETEELVDWIVQEVGNARTTILDIGTGSACIPIAIKKHLPESQVVSVDVSLEALQTAKENCRLNAASIRLLERNILNWQDYKWEFFDVIVSNPPYVRNLEKEEIKQNVLEFEPGLALFVDDHDPLVFYKSIAEFAKKNLNPQGRLFFEINEYLGEETCNMLIEKGFRDVELRKDLNGKDRMIRCKKV